MKKLLILFLFIQTLFPQKLSKQKIKHSDNYYYGTGISMNSEEARDKALSELTSQIAVRVSSSFEEKLKEKDAEVTEATKKILKTHSAATLKNVKSIKKPVGNGRIEVFCYLAKSEVDKIFKQRKKLIAKIIDNAREYEEEYNYAYALKNYYFANLLLNSLPDQNVIFNDTNFTTLIPKRINNIILNTEFEYQKECEVSDKEKEVTLEVNSNGHPISLLDFTFWDGNNQVDVQARDGIACVRLVGSSVDFEKLRLNIKYSYYKSRKEYSVVADLWNLVTRPTFDVSKTVELKKKKAGGLISTKEVVSKTDDFNLKLKTKKDSAPVENICQDTKQLLHILENNNIDRIDQFCGNDTFLNKKLTDYVDYNNPSPQERNVGAYINKTENGWEVRKIRMLHRYPSIHKQSTEYLVLDFSKAGELRDINVAITKELYNKFVKQGKFGNDWDNRQQIVKFLEKYRTAYISRDINTVEKMFAEDALIIVGRKIKRKTISAEEMYNKTGNEPDYEYLRMKKEEYINRQKRIFEYQQDIFLDFASFEINRKNNQPSIYGVEMRQNYFSTTYSDEGYLFLLIDFAKEDPTIYVRAWQPNEWSDDKLIKTANFKVYK